MSEKTKATIYTYWRGWITEDFDAMRRVLADTVIADAALCRVEGADNYVALCAEGAPWRDVVMIDEMYGDNQAAILYEGINTANDHRMRVAELIQLKDDRITMIQSCLSPLTMLENAMKGGEGS